MACSRGCCETQIEHYKSLQISPSVYPTRQDARYKPTDDLEKGWAKDIPSYKRLVKDGLQPQQVDGCAEAEAKADYREQIETETYDPIVSA